MEVSQFFKFDIGLVSICMFFVFVLLAMVANAYACNLLKKNHLKVYLNLDAPTLQKLNMTTGRYRRQWNKFIRQKQYLMLRDPQLNKICALVYWIDKVSILISLIAALFFAYAVYQCGYLDKCGWYEN